MVSVFPSHSHVYIPSQTLTMRICHCSARPTPYYYADPHGHTRRAARRATSPRSARQAMALPIRPYTHELHYYAAHVGGTYPSPFILSLPKSHSNDIFVASESKHYQTPISDAKCQQWLRRLRRCTRISRLRPCNRIHNIFTPSGPGLFRCLRWLLQ